MATFPGTPAADDETSLSNVMYGDDGNDSLASGAAGLVTMDGGEGDDALQVFAFQGPQTLNAYGGNGGDLIGGSTLADALYGGEGNDLVFGQLPTSLGPRHTEFPDFPSGNDQISGDGGADALFGADGDDVIFGGAGDENGALVTWRGQVSFSSGLYGGSGDDLLDGGPGADLLVGGNGLDILIGGTGADRFAFEASIESGKGLLADVIRDFSRADGDHIDLSLIDAKPNPNKPGDQAFKFSQADDFNGKAGHVIYKGSKVQVDVDGNGKADFHIKLFGVEHLAKEDFIL